MQRRLPLTTTKLTDEEIIFFISNKVQINAKGRFLQNKLLLNKGLGGK